MSMDTKQLLDSLADHMALYHRASSQSGDTRRSQYRINVMRWMSSLTPQQRQAALTTVDEHWLAILLQMRDHVLRHGHGFFILLPDMPDRFQIPSSSRSLQIPSLCYRKARGLLARDGEDAEAALTGSVLLFSSSDGNNDATELRPLNTLTVSEEFVSDVNRFVKVMDSVSNSEFLMSSSNASSSSWDELPWLKAKGFYSLGSFVANRIELSLGLSWMHSRLKKRGGPPRSGTGNARDVAFSAFWRKKGVIDWWCQLDPATRSRAFQLALSKASKLEPDITLPLQSPEIENNPSIQTALAKLHNILHEEIECFCKKIASENQRRKPFVNAAVDKVTRALQVLWPRSRTKIFGSIATGLALPSSDVDVVVCLPPVRNLEPIKEAGILEGRNGIKETCLQHAARYLADQDWVKTDSLKTIENTAIPIIMLVVKLPSQHSYKGFTVGEVQERRNELLRGCEQRHISGIGISAYSSGDIRACEGSCASWSDNEQLESVRLDISFESASHTGLRTASLVRDLTGKFPAIIPLALVFKQFLTDRCLDHPYSGGLSSYCLVLLITRFLQHQHHAGRSINQNLGRLFLDFLYFFGCVFDPRQMRISIYGSGMYVNRGRAQSIDPLHIDDPLDDPIYPVNNVGRNCFRIHQCIKAFADAHSILKRELLSLDFLNISDSNHCRVLQKVIPSFGDLNKRKT